MKLIVLVPSEAYRTNAGARIRYYRLEGALKEQGIDLTVLDIGSFDVDTSDADVLLISKCHDYRAHLVAIAAIRRDIAVGVDLFDDYFSQADDSRMVRFRRWLGQLAPLLSFALASTPTMAAVLKAYRADLDVKVVNDPAASNDDGLMIASAGQIAEKFDQAVNERRLQVAWFGIGDNPHFAVGLHDLSAFSAELAAMARLSGATVDLAILTNARALTADRVAMIAALPVPARVEEWNEDAENALLNSSFACFLPVNAQPFSAAKSLNRAVTALASGCQILSAGYPLYAQFGSLIYSDAETLASDFQRGTLRVSAARYAELVDELSQWGSADAEAKGLAIFLSGITARPKGQVGQIAVMHGAATNGLVHKLAHKNFDLSVATPYAPKLPGVDAMTLSTSALHFSLLVSKEFAKRAKLALARPSPEDNARPGFVRVTDGETQLPDGMGMNLVTAPLAVQIALYETAMNHSRSLLQRELGVTTTILSDMSPIPFPCSVPAPSDS